MTSAELKNKIETIEWEAKNMIHEARKEFVEANKRFDVGDFVFNVTGIIKIDTISYQTFLGVTQVRYVGKRYRKAKGVLIRTKYKYSDSFTDGDNLKKMDITNLTIE